ncbi:Uncharacterised protein [Escherichia coli]|nr:Uncharacterised protein [Escherichia coli]
MMMIYGMFVFELRTLPASAVTAKQKLAACEK